MRKGNHTDYPYNLPARLSASGDVVFVPRDRVVQRADGSRLILGYTKPHLKLHYRTPYPDVRIWSVSCERMTTSTYFYSNVAIRAAAGYWDEWVRRLNGHADTGLAS